MTPAQANTLESKLEELIAAVKNENGIELSPLSKDILRVIVE